MPRSAPHSPWTSSPSWLHPSRSRCSLSRRRTTESRASIQRFCSSRSGRNARRMVLFCQAGQTYSPAESSPLFAYLEDLVVEVDPGSGGVFHPKIWVLRFKSPAGVVRYRLLCASRNLTFDRCWDSVVCLEGTLTDRTLAYSQNRPLGDLLARLPQLATGRPVPTGISELVAQVQSEVRRVKFETPEPFDSHTFWAGGVGGRGGGPLAERCDRALVVSPFCSAGTLENIVGGEGDHS